MDTWVYLSRRNACYVTKIMGGDMKITYSDPKVRETMAPLTKNSHLQKPIIKKDEIETLLPPN